MSGAGPSAPVISFLSDYGLADEFVGVCHGVIARRCPEARIIDLTHAIPRHDVLAGALTLRSSLEHVPAGVHLAVVDPQVGAQGAGARRAIALRTGREDRLLVGPDNGLLILAAEHFGGASRAVDIGNSPERLKPVSRTFHGRDIFAPVAAALAAGVAMEDLGEPMAVTALVQPAVPHARSEGDCLLVHVLLRDGFGNLTTDATPEQLDALAAAGSELTVRGARGTRRAVRGLAFADVPAGEMVLLQDGQRMLALAVNRGSAAELLGAGPGDELLLGRA